MIYFQESINIFKIFGKQNTMDMDTILKKSSLKENDLKHLLGYMLYMNFIDLSNDSSFVITNQGQRFFKCFFEYKSETMNVIYRLRNAFPQALTKKECSEGIPSLVFKDIYILLKDQGYMDIAQTVTNYEMIRLSPSGFNLLDYFEMQSKLNQLLS